jgi:putative FmdB family regulatory protein
MPIYEYEHDGKRGKDCAERFELVEAMSAEPTARCPRCNENCHRVPSTFGVQAGGRSGILSKSNLEAHGFSQFTRKGKGYYEKTAGAGPGAIAGE